MRQRVYKANRRPPLCNLSKHVGSSVLKPMMLANVSVPLFCACIGASLHAHCVFPYFCSKKKLSYPRNRKLPIFNSSENLLDNTNDMLLLMGNYVWKEVRHIYSKLLSFLCFPLNLPAFVVGDDNEILLSQISSCLHRETYTNSSRWKVSSLVIQLKLGFDWLWSFI